MASNFGRIAMRLVLVVTLTVLWLMPHPDATYACSCMSVSPSEAFERADAVFVGRAVSVTGVEIVHGDATYVDSLITEFDVATVWKGPVEHTIHIRSGADGASCGYRFTEDGEYIVYAYYSENREGLRTGLCARTAELSWGLEDLAALGEGERPGVGANAPASASSESGGGCSASAGVVDLAFVGALAGLVCIGVRRRGRPRRKLAARWP